MRAPRGAFFFGASERPQGPILGAFWQGEGTPIFRPQRLAVIL